MLDSVLSDTSKLRLVLVTPLQADAYGVQVGGQNIGTIGESQPRLLMQATVVRTLEACSEEAASAEWIERIAEPLDRSLKGNRIDFAADVTTGRIALPRVPCHRPDACDGHWPLDLRSNYERGPIAEWSELTITGFARTDSHM